MGNAKAKQPKTAALGEESVSRLIMKFSAATLAGLLLNAVYVLIDALFVSWGVGDDAMGGVSVVFPFVLLQGAVSTAVGGGAASIVSRRFGEKRFAEAGEVTVNAMLVFYGSAIITTLLGFLLLDPILSLLGVTAELYPYARQFFIILLAGNVFSTGFSSIIRAEGRMLYGMLIWIIPISVNILLDALFILRFGWGVRGSALATTLCQFVSFCMWVLFAVRFSSQTFRGARPRLKTIADILSTGLPSLVQMGSLSVSTTILNNVLGDAGGSAGISTFAYISKLLTFAVIPFTAVTQALAPVLGFNYGAKNAARVKKTVRFCIGISLFYAAAAALLLAGIPKILMGIFTDDETIITLGVNGLRRVAPSLLFMPLPMLSGAVFQAVGQKLRALLMYSANLLLLIPFAFLLERRLGLNGVWLAYTAASAGTGLLAPAVILPAVRKMSDSFTRNID